MCSRKVSSFGNVWAQLLTTHLYTLMIDMEQVKGEAGELPSLLPPALWHPPGPLLVNGPTPLLLFWLEGPLLSASHNDHITLSSGSGNTVKRWHCGLPISYWSSGSPTWVHMTVTDCWAPPPAYLIGQVWWPEHAHPNKYPGATGPETSLWELLSSKPTWGHLWGNVHCFDYLPLIRIQTLKLNINFYKTDLI